MQDLGQAASVKLSPETPAALGKRVAVMFPRSSAQLQCRQVPVTTTAHVSMATCFPVLPGFWVLVVSVPVHSRIRGPL